MKCKNCNKEFKPRTKQNRDGTLRKTTFCSVGCYKAYRLDKKWTKRECVFCHKEFKYRSKQQDRKCCSLRCNSKYGQVLTGRNKQIKTNCLVCKKEILSSPSDIKNGKGKYCSKKCYWSALPEYWAGDKNPKWNGGITPLYRKIRTSTRFYKWRNAVLKRDDYTCKKCGYNPKYDEGNINMEAHHLLMLKDLLLHNLKKHIFNLDNGITLCQPCHQEITNNQKLKEGIYER